MARAALSWSIEDLSKAAAVGKSTVLRFETGKAQPIQATLEAMKRALEAAGVRFTDTGVDLPSS